MKEISIITETKSSLMLAFPSQKGLKPILQGMTETFTYETMGLDLTAKTLIVFLKDRRFIGYRLAYVMADDELMIVEYSNTVYARKDYDKIDIKILSVPNGQISISYISDEFYDVYRLFDEDNNCIYETNECMCLGNFYDKKYYVCGYKKDKETLILHGMSNLFECNPETYEIPKTTKLSIVVAIYNAKKFLYRTIQSILASTFKELEIILIDDGSEKETADICDQYSNLYSNIKVIHKKNEGHCIARNTGIDNATSEWLAIMDHDDIVHPMMYEKLFKATEEYHTDIAIAQCIVQEDFDKRKLIFPDSSKNNFVVKNTFEEMIISKPRNDNLYFVAIWNKIIKTDIAKKVKFLDHWQMYEDTAYTSTLYTYLDKFVMVKDAYYFWEQRLRLTTGTKTTHDNELGRSQAQVWVYDILSYMSPLREGNQVPEKISLCKQDIFAELMTYYERQTKPASKEVFEGLFKYYHQKYNLEPEKLPNTKRGDGKKLYESWLKIEESDTEPWDGKGEIPKSYYKNYK